MRVVGFGTYDGAKQPRIEVVLQGLRSHGAHVERLNRPLGFSTAERVDMLHRPWLTYRLVRRISARWVQLATARFRHRPRPDVVVVGYLAQIDALLARALFPSSLLVLDLLVFADDTARDRGVGNGLRTVLLRLLDLIAIRVASTVMVDTDENLALLPANARHKAVVIPVGATTDWFAPGVDDAGPESNRPLKVVFFGLFTPLQGAPVIGAALSMLSAKLDIEVTMIGDGQDYEETRAHVPNDPRISWIPWVDPQELPFVVRQHDVCLGIFGTGPKAQRVTPTKVYQGAAAGCAIVTSATPPQRRMLGNAALFVQAGSPEQLAWALRQLNKDRRLLGELKLAALRKAETEFTATQVTRPLFDHLIRQQGQGGGLSV